MKELELPIWIVTIVVFVTQILFLYLRTINVRAIAHDKLLAAIISGIGIAVSWMISTAISISSVLEGELAPIIAHLIGGAVGTYWGMKYDKRK